MEENIVSVIYHLEKKGYNLTTRCQSNKALAGLVTNVITEFHIVSNTGTKKVL